MSQNEFFFLLNCLSQVFCDSDGKGLSQTNPGEEGEIGNLLLHFIKEI
jgi:hypothetical protein